MEQDATGCDRMRQDLAGCDRMKQDGIGWKRKEQSGKGRTGWKKNLLFYLRIYGSRRDSSSSYETKNLIISIGKNVLPLGKFMSRSNLPLRPKTGPAYIPPHVLRGR